MVGRKPICTAKEGLIVYSEKLIPPDAGEEGVRYLQTLISGLQWASDPHMRAYAVREIPFAVKKLPAARDGAIAILLEAVKDSDSMVRSRAISALGTLKASVAVETIIAALKSDASVRDDAARALANIGDRRAVAPLVDVLNYRDPTWSPAYALNMRRTVAEALKEFKDPALVGVFIKALTDDSVGVRCVSAKALGELADTCAVEPLIAALAFTKEDPSSSLSIEAAKALGKIGDHRAIAPLINVLRSNRIDVTHIVVMFGPAALSPLVSVLADRNASWQARGHAAVALGELKDVRAVDPLLDALGDPTDWVTKMVVDSLRLLTGVDLNEP